MTEAGTVVAGKYRLEHLLGEGGMGAVWAGTHLLTRKRVAIKLLKAEVASADTLKRFVREARAASAVRHPNVVEVHDFLTMDDGSPAMVMDFLEGETLGQRLARHGALPLAELAAIMAPVVSAVGTAHAAGIVHRDLKPENIFLARLGDGRVEPMVLDFGIAKVLPFSEEMGVSALTQTGAMLGTPYYMAPEQAFGEDIDARADVWALGVILYECSSGLKPIEGETLGQVFKAITTGKPKPLQVLAPHLPSDFVLMVERMMQRSRDDRFSDLREPLQHLRSWSVLPHPGGVPSLPPPRGAAANIPSSLASSQQATRVKMADAHGLGASAVPVTRGVNRPAKSGRSALLLAVSLGALFGAGALAAVSLRQPGAAAPQSSIGLPAVAPVSVAVAAMTPPVASVAPEEPAASASAPAPVPSVRRSASPTKPVPRVKAGGGSPRKLLPGGVDESPPF